MKRFCLPLLLFCMVVAASFARDPDASAFRPKKQLAAADVNYDFTKINYYAASGILFDMLVSSEKYVGKTVKIKGQFLSDVYDGRRVCAVMLWDQAGCCPTGLEIAPTGGMGCPSDFPEPGSYATFSGTLKMLTVAGEEALYLVAESWE